MLKALGHEGRLMILCHQSHGEKTVSELQALLSAPQALVSSQLARFCNEQMVNEVGKRVFSALFERFEAEYKARQ